MFDLAAYKSLIKARCGLSFEGSDESKLTAALAARVGALAIAPEEYYPRLHAGEGEFQQLVNLLTINETYFFREPAQIQCLVARLAPRFLAEGSVPIRILCAGCSSGEEPYSLVMALMEKYGESVERLFTVVGGDIDSSVLDKARQGQYGEFSFRGMSAEVRQRYFKTDRQGSALKEEVRRQVSFHELNVLTGEGFAALGEFDIIFFRNVSIYFDAPTRRIIQQNLHARMKPNAVLVVGTTETLANDLGVLTLVEEEGLFYFTKGRSPMPALSCSFVPVSPEPAWPPSVNLPPPLVPPGDWFLPSTEVSSTVVCRSESVPAAAAGVRALARGRQATWEGALDQALPELDAVLALGEGPGQTEARLLKAYVLINRKDFAAAEPLLQAVLAVDEWSVDAMLLAGLAAKWQGRQEEALRWFKQAVYNHRDCWPAHYGLAELYRQGTDWEAARRAYRKVMQLLTEAADSGLRYVPPGLPVGEVRFLCEHQLARLEAGKPPVGQR